MWCIDLNPPKCIISRDVIFNENELAVKRQPIEETNFDTKTFEIVEFEVEASSHKSIKGVAYSKDADIDPNKQWELNNQYRQIHVLKNKVTNLPGIE